jgi:hypothetical protein
MSDSVEGLVGARFPWKDDGVVVQGAGQYGRFPPGQKSEPLLQLRRSGGFEDERGNLEPARGVPGL